MWLNNNQDLVVPPIPKHQVRDFIFCCFLYIVKWYEFCMIYLYAFYIVFCSLFICIICLTILCALLIIIWKFQSHRWNIFVPIYHFYLNELKRRKKNRGKSVISPINFQLQRLLHDADEQLYAIISLYVYLYKQLNKHNWFQQILMYIFFTLTVFNRIIKQYILECFNVVTIFLVELFWRCQKLMVLMSCERLNSHAYWKLSPG